MTPYTWHTHQVLRATGGSVVAGKADLVFTGIGIDSRGMDPQHLFVAITGERHDGHRYVADVIDQGVKGVVVAKGKAADLPMDKMVSRGVVGVAVTNTTEALGALARFNRNRGDLKVVAITGSNGKTSTRMLTEGVIAGTYETLSTSGNLNNHIGLPLTLFQLTPDHQAAVLELGMNHAGEIDYLGGICRPDVGIITNVAPAHLEGLGSVDNVLSAKAELLGTLRAGGTAILNADDARVTSLADKFDCPVVFFGVGGQAHVRADNIRPTESGLAFDLVTPSGDIAVMLATPARVMVSNALAAAAAGEVAGVPLNSIKAGLEAFRPQSGRMDIRQLAQDICVIDDTYNANPASIKAAVDTLARMRRDRRTIAVLGDMLELGAQSADLHREIGRAVGDAGIDFLYITGNFATFVADGAMDQQMPSTHIAVDTRDAIAAQLSQQLRPGDLILVKGSRGMAMEKVVEAIIQWTDNQ